MSSLGLTWFDIVAAVVVIGSAVHAYNMGFIRDIFGVVAFVVAGLAALMLAHSATALVAQVAPKGAVTPLLVTLGVFLIVYVLIKVVTGRIAISVDNTKTGGSIDRGLGGVYGLARGIFLMTLIVFALRSVAGDPNESRNTLMPDAIAHSATFPFFNGLATTLVARLPKSAGGQAV